MMMLEKLVASAPSIQVAVGKTRPASCHWEPRPPARNIPVECIQR